MKFVSRVTLKYFQNIADRVRKVSMKPGKRKKNDFVFLNNFEKLDNIIKFNFFPFQYNDGRFITKLT